MNPYRVQLVDATRSVKKNNLLKDDSHTNNMKLKDLAHSGMRCAKYLPCVQVDPHLLLEASRQD